MNGPIRLLVQSYHAELVHYWIGDQLLTFSYLHQAQHIRTFYSSHFTNTAFLLLFIAFITMS